MPYLNLNDEVGERPEYDAWRETDATRRYPPDMPLCPATLLEVTQRIPNFTAETRQLGKHSRTYEGAMPREPNEAPTTEMRKRRRVIADVSGELHGNVAEDYPLEPAPRAPPYHPMEVDEDEEEFTPHLPEGDEGPNDTYRMQYCYGVNPRSLTQAHMPPPVPPIDAPMPNATGQRRRRQDDIFGPRALNLLHNILQSAPDFTAPRDDGETQPGWTTQWDQGEPPKGTYPPKNKEITVD